MKIYFSDFFNVSPDDLEKYGALDVSLIADLPLFIDPFLLFNSEDSQYQRLHEQMIEYMQFLKAKAERGTLPEPLIKNWYKFSEVKQNWLGYDLDGNNGRGPGMGFARALHASLHTFFKDFGEEKITRGRHIEKLCLISGKIGKDNISDFTTNLIKGFLLKYTEEFARSYIHPKLTRKVSVPRARFNYTTESWQTEKFVLPWYGNDYVLLTPEDILTRDETWISQGDLFHRYEDVANSLPNEQLRWQLHNYLTSVLPKPKKGKEITRAERHTAILKVVQKYPEIIDFYIRNREDDGDEAVRISKDKVDRTKSVFIEQLRQFVDDLEEQGFYKLEPDSHAAAKERVRYLKESIENNDGYRFFYDTKGEPIEREKDLQLIFRLTWYGTSFEVDSEVNNGRGPVDYKISKGSADKTLVEFKLASNKQLEQNLAHQVEVYKKANKTAKALKVVLYFTKEEFDRVTAILKRLRLENDPSVILIDARRDNKTSASKVKTAKRGN